MKKLLICVAALTMLSGVTAMADGGYSSADQSVSITDADSNTVLIAKNTGADIKSEDIVYVGQNNDGFTNGTSFLLKNDTATLTDGFYTIVLGNANGTQAKKTNFFIGDASAYFSGTGTTTLKPLTDYEVEEGTGSSFTRAYVSEEALDVSNIKTIIVTYGDTTVYSSVDSQTELTGGSAKVGVKLSGIESDTDNITVSISSKEATGLKLN